MLNQTMQQQIEETRARHEFLTFLVLASDKHSSEPDIRCGIVQNETAKMIMFFDFEKIKSEDAKRRFLKYADEWWWESNQSTPIDSFIGDRFEEFLPALTGYPKKSLECDPIGPRFSLADQYLKRIKKKRVDIVNRK